MKNLILSLFLVLTTTAQASGKFVFKKDIIATKGVTPYLQSNPEMTVIINEKLINALEYQTMTTINAYNWFLSEHYVLVNIGETLKAGAGPYFNNDVTQQTGAGLKALVELKVW